MKLKYQVAIRAIAFPKVQLDLIGLMALQPRIAAMMILGVNTAMRAMPTATALLQGMDKLGSPYFDCEGDCG